MRPTLTPSRAARLALVLAGAVGRCPAASQRAAVDSNQPGLQIRGFLNLDAATAARGQVDIVADVSQKAAPPRTNGPGSAGRYTLHVELEAEAAADNPAGAARLAGTFRTADGCESRVAATGRFTSASTPPTLTVTLDWPEVSYVGCDIKSPRPLHLKLPAFTVAASETPARPTTPTPPDPPTRPTTPRHDGPGTVATTPGHTTTPGVEPPGEGEDDGGPFAGAWQTDLGPVTLLQMDDRVVGFVLKQKMSLDGNVLGNLLSFRLTKAGRVVGVGRWQLNDDGDAVSGNWHTIAQPEGPGQPWNGKLIGPLLTPDATEPDGPTVVGPTVTPPREGAEGTAVTRTEGLPAFGDQPGNPKEVAIPDMDLKTVKPLDTLTITFRAKPEGQPSLRVLVSDDGQNYDQAFRLRTQAIGGPEAPLAIKLVGVQARFIRLMVDPALLPLVQRYTLTTR